MNKIILIIFVIFLCLGTILPLFQNGFFEFHDNTQVVRVYEMYLSLQDKMFPVRWVGGLGYGYGYPIFNFYAPFPYYLGAIFMSVGFNALSATKLIFALGILLSGVTMFFFIKKYFGIRAGVVSAVIYAYFPYHAVNIYVRGAVGEFFAYAFLPIIFIGLFKILTVKYRQKLLLAEFNTVITISLGIFLVAISHNLTLLMLFILLPIHFITGIFSSVSKKAFVVLFLSSVILGVLLSSFYILPAFTEMNYTNVASQVGGGAAFLDHFVCVNQFWNSAWGYGGSVAGCEDGMSFKLGKLNIFILIIGVLALAWSYKKKRESYEKVALISLALFIFAIFLTIHQSELIWNSIPIMAYIQYPWRFLNFVGFFLSIIGAYLIFKLPDKIKYVKIGLVFLLVVITILTNQKLFEPQRYNDISPDYYTNKKYINFTVSKISDEYLPQSFAKPTNIAELPISSVDVIDTSGSVTILAEKISYLKIDYSIREKGKLLIRRAYFPIWNAYLNGQEVSIVENSQGMTIDIPKGKGVVELIYQQTGLQKIGNTLTIIAIVTLFVGIIVKRIYYKK